jgi:hypothetical protein
VGDTLSAVTGDTAPAGAVVSYQWTRSTDGTAVPVPGATSSTYAVTADDLGSTLRVVATGTLDSYAAGHAASVATGVVVAGTLPDPEVALSGSPRVASPLTASVALPDVPGLSVAWQWQVLTDNTAADIDGATSATLAPLAGHAGHALRAVATVTAPGYTSVGADADTATVAKGLLARPAVTISGAARQGRTLAAKVVSSGVHAHGTRVRYRWRAAGVKLPGATKHTLRLGRHTVGKKITVTVTTAAPGYAKVAVTSRATRTVRGS